MDFAQFGAMLRFVAETAMGRLEEGWGRDPGSVSAAPAALRLVFTLQRAGWALQQLLALERRIQQEHASSSSSSRMRSNRDTGTGRGSGNGAEVGDQEEVPYAAEVEASEQGLSETHAALRRLGFGHVLPTSV